MNVPVRWLVGGIVSVALLVSAAPSRAAEANWPQWRGPMHNGVAPDADPPTKWSET